MNDEIKINLNIADSFYPITIKREEEEIMRKAAKQVNTRLNTYREHYSKLTLEKQLAMVAYQFALEGLKQKDRNDTEPYISKIEELTKLMEDFFGNNQ